VLWNVPGSCLPKFTIDFSEIDSENAKFDVNNIQAIGFVFDLVEKGDISMSGMLVSDMTK